MIHTGSTDPIQFAGASQPKMRQSMRSSEYTASTVNICWNSDQNTALARNRGMKAATLVRSTGVTLALLSMTAK